MKNKIIITTRGFSPLFKIFAFIIIIKASFLVSFAFIWDDLWLDIYKNIDSGVTELNEKMYSNELKWSKPDWKISDKVNQFIQRAWIYWCEVWDLTEDDIEKISYWENEDVNKSWDISLLSEKLDWKCLEIYKLNQIQKTIKDYAKFSLKTAKQKSEDIYNISKVWLFSDWSIQNSPFDIVKDIKDIDYIIFTQEIDYVWEENVWENELSDYLNNKLDNLENKLNNSLNNNSDNNNLDNNNNNTNSNWENSEWNSNWIIDEIINWEEEWEQNQNWNNWELTCPIPDESWLSQEDLDKIINWNNWWYNSLENAWSENWNSNWNINSNYNWGSDLWDNPFSFTTWNTQSSWWSAWSQIWTNEYEPVNDNEYFGSCETFFCITIDYVTHEWNLLIWWTTRSIESIMDRSNNHLKKFANSSLVQSKMTTNNFELWLRGLSLPDIFSMPIVFIKKTPPILDLDYFNKKVASENKKKEDPNPLSWENLLKSRFDSAWMDRKRENDLSIYTNIDANIKNTINNAEMSTLKVKENNEKMKQRYIELSKLDDHITRIVWSNYQALDTDWLYKEFIELERFSSEIQDYTYNADKALDKMIKIPIHP